MQRRCVFLGFGTVAQTTFPLAVKLLRDQISEFVLIDRRQLTDEDLFVTKGFDVKIEHVTLTPDNIASEIDRLIHDNDMMFDFTCCIDTNTIIRTIGKKKNVIYVDTCLEEWEGMECPTQFALYQNMHKYDGTLKYTAVFDAGANPGLVTHFAILGLRGMAKSAIERGVPDADQIKALLEKGDVAALAAHLQVDVIHISEKEDMEPAKKENFVGVAMNSWSVGSFQEEWVINGEVSVGSQDVEDLSKDGYSPIPNSVPKFVQIPYPMHMHTANPNEVFTGRVVRHPETMEIADVFYDRKSGHVPTVAFVYQPSPMPRAVYKQEGWEKLPRKIMSELNGGPMKGYESMGALLISSRQDIPMRYYGSILSCEQAREVGCVMNPTTLQVAASAIAHMCFALQNPEMGLCMPHNFDSEAVMKIAAPYLGTVWDGDLKDRLSTKWHELISDEQL